MAPEAVALLSPGQDSITYLELLARIEALTRTFAEFGLNRKDVVAVSLPDGVDFVSLLFAVPSVAVCAPLNPAFSKTELEAYLTSIRARALIVERLDSPPATVAVTLGIEVLECAEVSRRARGSGPTPGSESPAPDDVAVLLHTSATTGGAKVVPLTHLNLQVMAANTRRMLDLSDADRLLSMMPLFHSQGLLSSLAQLLSGGGVICTSGFDARSFLSWIEELRPTWYTAGPALHKATLPTVQNQPNLMERAALRFVRSIGAAMPQDLMAALESALGVPVLEGYGMTEAGMVTSNAPFASGRKRGSVGRSGGVEIGIMNETGELMPSPWEGEIAVRGPAVAKSYFNDAEATRNAFRNGWFLTGDVGRVDDEGFLFVTGRIKEIINRGGEKIVPTEVDAVLSSHPAVAEAAAFGVSHPALGEEIHAAVVLRAGESVSESELRRLAADRLAHFKVPRRIFFLGAIPKGSTGKPKRASLGGEVAPLIDQMRARARAAGAPASAIEEKIAGIWKRILGVQEFGGEDDFFSLGGDSFGATLMLVEVGQEFGLEQSQLEDSDFFLSPDIATLARIVSDAGAAPPNHQRRAKPPLVALQPHGSRVPIFCFPGGDENPYYFRPLAQALGDDQPFFVVRDPRPLAERGVYTVEEAADRFTQVIRSVREGGPFILGGHCYGGIFAFEVARQLVARGEDVAMLFLIEVPAPGYPKFLRHWKDYARQAWSLLRKGHSPGFSEARSHLGVLKRLFRLRIAVFWRRLLMRAGLKRVVEPIEKSDHPHIQAGRSYRAKRLDCEVVQFIAGDEPHSTLILDDPRLGWQEFTQGEFTVRRTPGRAAAIFKPPQVKELAAQLSTLLDRFNTR